MDEKELSQRETIEGVSVFVGGTTSVQGLSTCIVAYATKEKRTSMKMRGIGASAINQMVKATIIAKSRLSEKGIKVYTDFYFKDVPSNRHGEGEKTISGIEFELEFEE